MKTTLMLVCVLLLGAGAVNAAPQAEESSNAVCAPAEEPSSASPVWKDEDAAEANARGYWHCTAYPEGGGHGHGHSAYDVHYDHAYYAALHACEHYHHYRHVHCHYDHH